MIHPEIWHRLDRCKMTQPSQVDPALQDAPKMAALPPPPPPLTGFGGSGHGAGVVARFQKH